MNFIEINAASDSPIGKIHFFFNALSYAPGGINSPDPKTKVN